MNLNRSQEWIIATFYMYESQGHNVEQKRKSHTYTVIIYEVQKCTKQTHCLGIQMWQT